MSLRELERRSGVNNSEIFKIESGEQDCRLESFLKISAALGIPWGRTLDDVIFTSHLPFADQIQKEPALRRFQEKFPEGLKQIALNIGMLAAWAAHLIYCGHPVMRARRVFYYSALLRDGFLTLAVLLDQLNDYGARREMIRELSAAPFRCLLAWNVLNDGVLHDLVHRLHPPAGKSLVIDRPALELLGFKHTSLVWFPFFPASFNQPACPEPRFAIEINIDKAQQPSDNSPVSLTWKELKRRLKNATAERGKKAAAADFAGVDRSNMNRWLDDDQQPGAEATFRLLEWVTAEEAKQKNSGTGATAPESKTQPKDTNESKLKSGRRRQ